MKHGMASVAMAIVGFLALSTPVLASPIIDMLPQVQLNVPSSHNQTAYVAVYLDSGIAQFNPALGKLTSIKFDLAGTYSGLPYSFGVITLVFGTTSLPYSVGISPDSVSESNNSGSFSIAGTDTFATDLADFTGAGTVQVGDQSSYVTNINISTDYLIYYYTPAPVPEPATATLLGCALTLLGVFGVGRRRFGG